MTKDDAEGRRDKLEQKKIVVNRFILKKINTMNKLQSIYDIKNSFELIITIISFFSFFTVFQFVCFWCLDFSFQFALFVYFFRIELNISNLSRKIQKLCVDFDTCGIWYGI